MFLDSTLTALADIDPRVGGPTYRSAFSVEQAVPSRRDRRPLT